jgi:hypothetical protein
VVGEEAVVEEVAIYREEGEERSKGALKDCEVPLLNVVEKLFVNRKLIILNPKHNYYLKLQYPSKLLTVPVGPRNTGYLT